MKKNVTIIGINYYPEDSAIGLYSTQKAEYLVNNGYNVSAIAGFPYYPQWKVSDDYALKKRYLKEEINGVMVYRFKQYVPYNPSFFRRIIHLTSYTLGSIINLFKIEKPDIVICIVPFTSTIVLGWLLKLRYNCKIWVHIQDFEFDAAIDSGLLNEKKSIIIKPLLWLERSLLKKANVISTISNGMMQKLEQKVKAKTYYLTNWIDTTMFKAKLSEKHDYLKSDKFKILYSGNIGAKQDWDFFFQFLDCLKDKDNVEVIVVGEGAEQESVKKAIDSYTFVRHYNLVPFEELYHLLWSADLHILFQKDDVIDTVMPSKILGMMGSGKPSIITGNNKSEVKQIIDKSEGGFYFNNGQMEDILNIVDKLQKDESEALRIGTKAKSFVIENYSKTKILNGFLEALKSKI